MERWVDEVVADGEVTDASEVGVPGVAGERRLDVIGLHPGVPDQHHR